ncbi:MAG: C10 family peptidase, partial [Bacteroidales bacterium]|nr:C10 family peptidase [Bacteroidales bacterium]
MKKSLISIFIALSAMIACNKDNAMSVSVQEEPIASEVIPMEEALANLEMFLSSYSSVTKSAKTRSIDDAEVIPFGSGTVKTRSTNTDIPDTLAYLVNLGDDEGFAVLSANRKLNNSIYCLTEEGSIDQDKFAAAYKYLSGEPETRSLSETKEMEDIFVPTLLVRSLIVDYYDETGLVETRASTPSGSPTGPILETKWHQNTPFNDLLNSCPAGCVAIACAQIMAYNEYPSVFTADTVTCSWSEMKTVAPVGNRFSLGSEAGRKQVAAFLKELGKDDNLKIRYDDDGSWGLADGVVRTL